MRVESFFSGRRLIALLTCIVCFPFALCRPKVSPIKPGSGSSSASNRHEKGPAWHPSCAVINASDTGGVLWRYLSYDSIVEMNGPLSSVNAFNNAESMIDWMYRHSLDENVTIFNPLSDGLDSDDLVWRRMVRLASVSKDSDNNDTLDGSITAEGQSANKDRTRAELRTLLIDIANQRKVAAGMTVRMSLVNQSYLPSSVLRSSTVGGRGRTNAKRDSSSNKKNRGSSGSNTIDSLNNTYLVIRTTFHSDRIRLPMDDNEGSNLCRMRCVNHFEHSAKGDTDTGHWLLLDELFTHVSEVVMASKKNRKRKKRPWEGVSPLPVCLWLSNESHRKLVMRRNEESVTEVAIQDGFHLFHSEQERMVNRTLNDTVRSINESRSSVASKIVLESKTVFAQAVSELSHHSEQVSLSLTQSPTVTVFERGPWIAPPVTWNDDEDESNVFNPEYRRLHRPNKTEEEQNAEPFGIRPLGLKMNRRMKDDFTVSKMVHRLGVRIPRLMLGNLGMFDDDRVFINDTSQVYVSPLFHSMFAHLMKVYIKQNRNRNDQSSTFHLNDERSESDSLSEVIGRVSIGLSKLGRKFPPLWTWMDKSDEREHSENCEKMAQLFVESSSIKHAMNESFDANVNYSHHKMMNSSDIDSYKQVADSSPIVFLNDSDYYGTLFEKCLDSDLYRRRHTVEEMVGMTERRIRNRAWMMEALERFPHGKRHVINESTDKRTRPSSLDEMLAAALDDYRPFCRFKPHYEPGYKGPELKEGDIDLEDYNWIDMEEEEFFVYFQNAMYNQTVKHLWNHTLVMHSMQREQQREQKDHNDEKNSDDDPSDHNVDEESEEEDLPLMVNATLAVSPEWLTILCQFPRVLSDALLNMDDGMDTVMNRPPHSSVNDMIPLMRLEFGMINETTHSKYTVLRMKSDPSYVDSSHRNVRDSLKKENITIDNGNRNANGSESYAFHNLSVPEMGAGTVIVRFEHRNDPFQYFCHFNGTANTTLGCENVVIEFKDAIMVTVYLFGRPRLLSIPVSMSLKFDDLHSLQAALIYSQNECLYQNNLRDSKSAAVHSHRSRSKRKMVEIMPMDHSLPANIDLVDEWRIVSGRVKLPRHMREHFKVEYFANHPRWLSNPAYIDRHKRSASVPTALRRFMNQEKRLESERKSKSKRQAREKRRKLLAEELQNRNESTSHHTQNRRRKSSMNGNNNTTNDKSSNMDSREGSSDKSSLMNGSSTSSSNSSSASSTNQIDLEELRLPTDPNKIGDYLEVNSDSLLFVPKLRCADSWVLQGKPASVKNEDRSDNGGSYGENSVRNNHYSSDEGSGSGSTTTTHIHFSTPNDGLGSATGKSGGIGVTISDGGSTLNIDANGATMTTTTYTTVNGRDNNGISVAELNGASMQVVSREIYVRNRLPLHNILISEIKVEQHKYPAWDELRRQHEREERRGYNHNNDHDYDDSLYDGFDEDNDDEDDAYGNYRHSYSGRVWIDPYNFVDYDMQCGKSLLSQLRKHSNDSSSSTIVSGGVANVVNEDCNCRSSESSSSQDSYYSHSSNSPASTISSVRHIDVVQPNEWMHICTIAFDWKRFLAVAGVETAVGNAGPGLQSPQSPLPGFSELIPSLNGLCGDVESHGRYNGSYDYTDKLILGYTVDFAGTSGSDAKGSQDKAVSSPMIRGETIVPIRVRLANSPRFVPIDQLVLKELNSGLASVMTVDFILKQLSVGKTTGFMSLHNFETSLDVDFGRVSVNSDRLLYAVKIVNHNTFPLAVKARTPLSSFVVDSARGTISMAFVSARQLMRYHSGSVTEKQSRKNLFSGVKFARGILYKGLPKLRDELYLLLSLNTEDALLTTSGNQQTVKGYVNFTLANEPIVKRTVKKKKRRPKSAKTEIVFDQWQHKLQLSVRWVVVGDSQDTHADGMTIDEFIKDNVKDEKDDDSLVITDEDDDEQDEDDEFDFDFDGDDQDGNEMESKHRNDHFQHASSSVSPSPHSSGFLSSDQLDSLDEPIAVFKPDILRFGSLHWFNIRGSNRFDNNDNNYDYDGDSSDDVRREGYEHSDSLMKKSVFVTNPSKNQSLIINPNSIIVDDWRVMFDVNVPLQSSSLSYRSVHGRSPKTKLNKQGMIEVPPTQTYELGTLSLGYDQFTSFLNHNDTSSNASLNNNHNNNQHSFPSALKKSWISFDFYSFPKSLENLYERIGNATHEARFLSAMIDYIIETDLHFALNMSYVRHFGLWSLRQLHPPKKRQSGDHHSNYHSDRHHHYHNNHHHSFAFDHTHGIGGSQSNVLFDDLYFQSGRDSDSACDEFKERGDCGDGPNTCTVAEQRHLHYVILERINVWNSPHLLSELFDIVRRFVWRWIVDENLHEFNARVSFYGDSPPSLLLGSVYVSGSVELPSVLAGMPDDDDQSGSQSTTMGSSFGRVSVYDTLVDCLIDVNEDIKDRSRMDPSILMTDPLKLLLFDSFNRETIEKCMGVLDSSAVIRSSLGSSTAQASARLNSAQSMKSVDLGSVFVGRMSRPLYFDVSNPFDFPLQVSLQNNDILRSKQWMSNLLPKWQSIFRSVQRAFGDYCRFAPSMNKMTDNGSPVPERPKSKAPSVADDFDDDDECRHKQLPKLVYDQYLRSKGSRALLTHLGRLVPSGVPSMPNTMQNENGLFECHTGSRQVTSLLTDAVVSFFMHMNVTSTPLSFAGSLHQSLDSPFMTQVSDTLVLEPYESGSIGPIYFAPLVPGVSEETIDIWMNFTLKGFGNTHSVGLDEESRPQSSSLLEGMFREQVVIRAKGVSASLSLNRHKFDHLRKSFVKGTHRFSRFSGHSALIDDDNHHHHSANHPDSYSSSNSAAAASPSSSHSSSSSASSSSSQSDSSVRQPTPLSRNLNGVPKGSSDESGGDPSSSVDFASLFQGVGIEGTGIFDEHSTIGRTRKAMGVNGGKSSECMICDATSVGNGGIHHHHHSNAPGIGGIRPNGAGANGGGYATIDLSRIHRGGGKDSRKRGSVFWLNARRLAATAMKYGTPGNKFQLKLMDEYVKSYLSLFGIGFAEMIYRFDPTLASPNLRDFVHDHAAKNWFGHLDRRSDSLFKVSRLLQNCSHFDRMSPSHSSVLLDEEYVISAEDQSRIQQEKGPYSTDYLHSFYATEMDATRCRLKKIIGRTVSIPVPDPHYYYSFYLSHGGNAVEYFSTDDGQAMVGVAGFMDVHFTHDTEQSVRDGKCVPIDHVVSSKLRLLKDQLNQQQREKQQYQSAGGNNANARDDGAAAAAVPIHGHGFSHSNLNKDPSNPASSAQQRPFKLHMVDGEIVNRVIDVSSSVDLERVSPSRDGRMSLAMMMNRSSMLLNSESNRKGFGDLTSWMRMTLIDDHIAPTKVQECLNGLRKRHLFTTLSDTSDPDSTDNLLSNILSTIRKSTGPSSDILDLLSAAVSAASSASALGGASPGGSALEAGHPNGSRERMAELLSDDRRFTFDDLWRLCALRGPDPDFDWLLRGMEEALASSGLGSVEAAAVRELDGLRSRLKMASDKSNNDYVYEALKSRGGLENPTMQNDMFVAFPMSDETFYTRSDSSNVRSLAAYSYRRTRNSSHSVRSTISSNAANNANGNINHNNPTSYHFSTDLDGSFSSPKFDTSVTTILLHYNLDQPICSEIPKPTNDYAFDTNLFASAMRSDPLNYFAMVNDKGLPRHFAAAAAAQSKKQRHRDHPNSGGHRHFQYHQQRSRMNSNANGRNHNNNNNHGSRSSDSGSSSSSSSSASSFSRSTMIDSRTRSKYQNLYESMQARFEGSGGLSKSINTAVLRDKPMTSRVSNDPLIREGLSLQSTPPIGLLAGLDTGSRYDHFGGGLNEESAQFRRKQVMGVNPNKWNAVRRRRIFDRIFERDRELFELISESSHLHSDAVDALYFTDSRVSKHAERRRLRESSKSFWWWPMDLVAESGQINGSSFSSSSSLSSASSSSSSSFNGGNHAGEHTVRIRIDHSVNGHTINTISANIHTQGASSNSFDSSSSLVGWSAWFHAWFVDVHWIFQYWPFRLLERDNNNNDNHSGIAGHSHRSSRGIHSSLHGRGRSTVTNTGGVPTMVSDMHNSKKRVPYRHGTMRGNRGNGGDNAQIIYDNRPTLEGPFVQPWYPFDAVHFDTLKPDGSIGVSSNNEVKNSLSAPKDLDRSGITGSLSLDDLAVYSDFYDNHLANHLRHSPHNLADEGLGFQLYNLRNPLSARRSDAALMIPFLPSDFGMKTVDGTQTFAFVSDCDQVTTGLGGASASSSSIIGGRYRKRRASEEGLRSPPLSQWPRMSYLPDDTEERRNGSNRASIGGARMRRMRERVLSRERLCEKKASLMESVARDKAVFLERKFVLSNHGNTPLRVDSISIVPEDRLLDAAASFDLDSLISRFFSSSKSSSFHSSSSSSSSSSSTKRRSSSFDSSGVRGKSSKTVLASSDSSAHIGGSSNSAHNGDASGSKWSKGTEEWNTAIESATDLMMFALSCRNRSQGGMNHNSNVRHSGFNSGANHGAKSGSANTILGQLCESVQRMRELFDESDGKGRLSHANGTQFLQPEKHVAFFTDPVTDERVARYLTLSRQSDLFAHGTDALTAVSLDDLNQCSLSDAIIESVSANNVRKQKRLVQRGKRQRKVFSKQRSLAGGSSVQSSSIVLGSPHSGMSDGSSAMHHHSALGFGASSTGIGGSSASSSSHGSSSSSGSSASSSSSSSSSGSSSGLSSRQSLSSMLSLSTIASLPGMPSRIAGVKSSGLLSQHLSPFAFVAWMTSFFVEIDERLYMDPLAYQEYQSLKELEIATDIHTQRNSYYRRSDSASSSSSSGNGGPSSSIGTGSSGKGGSDGSRRQVSVSYTLFTVMYNAFTSPLFGLCRLMFGDLFSDCAASFRRLIGSDLPTERFTSDSDDDAVCAGGQGSSSGESFSSEVFLSLDQFFFYEDVSTHQEYLNEITSDYFDNGGRNRTVLSFNAGLDDDELLKHISNADGRGNSDLGNNQERSQTSASSTSTDSCSGSSKGNANVLSKDWIHTVVSDDRIGQRDYGDYADFLDDWQLSFEPRTIFMDTELQTPGVNTLMYETQSRLTVFNSGRLKNDTMVTVRKRVSSVNVFGELVRWDASIEELLDSVAVYRRSAERRAFDSTVYDSEENNNENHGSDNDYKKGSQLSEEQMRELFGNDNESGDNESSEDNPYDEELDAPITADPNIMSEVSGVGTWSKHGLVSMVLYLIELFGFDFTEATMPSAMKPGAVSHGLSVDGSGVPEPWPPKHWDLDGQHSYFEAVAWTLPRNTFTVEGSERLPLYLSPGETHEFTLSLNYYLLDGNAVDARMFVKATQVIEQKEVPPQRKNTRNKKRKRKNDGSHKKQSSNQNNIPIFDLHSPPNQNHIVEDDLDSSIPIVYQSRVSFRIDRSLYQAMLTFLPLPLHEKLISQVFNLGCLSLILIVIFVELLRKGKIWLAASASAHSNNHSDLSLDSSASSSAAAAASVIGGAGGSATAAAGGSGATAASISTSLPVILFDSTPPSIRNANNRRRQAVANHLNHASMNAVNGSSNIVNHMGHSHQMLANGVDPLGNNVAHHPASSSMSSSLGITGMNLNHLGLGSSEMDHSSPFVSRLNEMDIFDDSDDEFDDEELTGLRGAFVSCLKLLRNIILFLIGVCKQCIDALNLTYILLSEFSTHLFMTYGVSTFRAIRLSMDKKRRILSDELLSIFDGLMRWVYGYVALFKARIVASLLGWFTDRLAFIQLYLRNLEEMLKPALVALDDTADADQHSRHLNTASSSSSSSDDPSSAVDTPSDDSELLSEAEFLMDKRDASKRHGESVKSNDHKNSSIPSVKVRHSSMDEDTKEEQNQPSSMIIVPKLDGRRRSVVCEGGSLNNNLDPESSSYDDEVHESTLGVETELSTGMDREDISFPYVEAEKPVSSSSNSAHRRRHHRMHHHSHVSSSSLNHHRKSEDVMTLVSDSTPPSMTDEIKSEDDSSDMAASVDSVSDAPSDEDKEDEDDDEHSESYVMVGLVHSNNNRRLNNHGKTPTSSSSIKENSPDNNLMDEAVSSQRHSRGASSSYSTEDSSRTRKSSSMIRTDEVNNNHSTVKLSKLESSSSTTASASSFHPRSKSKRKRSSSAEDGSLMIVGNSPSPQRLVGARPAGRGRSDSQVSNDSRSTPSINGGIGGSGSGQISTDDASNSQASSSVAISRSKRKKRRKTKRKRKQTPSVSSITVDVAPSMGSRGTRSTALARSAAPTNLDQATFNPRYGDGHASVKANHHSHLGGGSALRKPPLRGSAGSGGHSVSSVESESVHSVATSMSSHSKSLTAARMVPPIYSGPGSSIRRGLASDQGLFSTANSNDGSADFSSGAMPKSGGSMRMVPVVPPLGSVSGSAHGTRSRPSSAVSSSESPKKRTMFAVKHDAHSSHHHRHSKQSNSASSSTTSSSSSKKKPPIKSRDGGNSSVTGVAGSTASSSSAASSTRRSDSSSRSIDNSSTRRRSTNMDHRRQSAQKRTSDPRQRLSPDAYSRVAEIPFHRNEDESMVPSSLMTAASSASSASVSASSVAIGGRSSSSFHASHSGNGTTKTYVRKEPDSVEPLDSSKNTSQSGSIKSGSGTPYKFHSKLNVHSKPFVPTGKLGSTSSKSSSKSKSSSSAATTNTTPTTTTTTTPTATVTQKRRKKKSLSVAGEEERNGSIPSDEGRTKSSVMKSHKSVGLFTSDSISSSHGENHSDVASDGHHHHHPHPHHMGHFASSVHHSGSEVASSSVAYGGNGDTNVIFGEQHSQSDSPQQKPVAYATVELSHPSETIPMTYLVRSQDGKLIPVPPLPDGRPPPRARFVLRRRSHLKETSATAAGSEGAPSLTGSSIGPHLPLTPGVTAVNSSGAATSSGTPIQHHPHHHHHHPHHQHHHHTLQHRVHTYGPTTSTPASSVGFSSRTPDLDAIPPRRQKEYQHRMGAMPVPDLSSTVTRRSKSSTSSSSKKGRSSSKSMSPTKSGSPAVKADNNALFLDLSKIGYKSAHHHHSAAVPDDLTTVYLPHSSHSSHRKKSKKHKRSKHHSQQHMILNPAGVPEYYTHKRGGSSRVAPHSHYHGPSASAVSSSAAGSGAGPPPVYPGYYMAGGGGSAMLGAGPMYDGPVAAGGPWMAPSHGGHSHSYEYVPNSGPSTGTPIGYDVVSAPRYSPQMMNHPGHGPPMAAGVSSSAGVTHLDRPGHPGIAPMIAHGIPAEVYGSPAEAGMDEMMMMGGGGADSVMSYRVVGDDMEFPELIGMDDPIPGEKSKSSLRSITEKKRGISSVSHWDASMVKDGARDVDWGSVGRPQTGTDLMDTEEDLPVEWRSSNRPKDWFGGSVDRAMSESPPPLPPDTDPAHDPAAGQSSELSNRNLDTLSIASDELPFRMDEFD